MAGECSPFFLNCNEAAEPPAWKLDQQNYTEGNEILSIFTVHY